ncbi:MAG: VOC family protein [Oceanicaulis sp.]|uniref:VOC family protein n=1 Tax=Glycocaulis sp. TaxID=1969725 RepID=UPI0025C525B7|nr:VOC family protein [Glycocaulis sp.]MCC5980471.1 VOC family protein [Oceanicaulis sp.]MCH8522089.1 VOC family protein [Glycocaulis sp.]
MNTRLGAVTLVVRDYDEAIDFFVNRLGFTLESDESLGVGKRWVIVAPSGAGQGGCRLLLARAVTSSQRAAIGAQTGGRVFLFLETDDFDRDYQRFRINGVVFRETPRDEDYGRVAVFEDICGNLWDLIEPRTAAR